jgi:hypothetical protein
MHFRDFCGSGPAKLNHRVAPMVVLPKKDRPDERGPVFEDSRQFRCFESRA